MEEAQRQPTPFFFSPKGYFPLPNFCFVIFSAELEEGFLGEDKKDKSKV